LDGPALRLGSFARAFVALHRVFGAIVVTGGLLLLIKCAWHLLQGTRQWSQEYFAVVFGLAIVIAGSVYLRALSWGSASQSGSED
jgi:hypothetical protein